MGINPNYLIPVRNTSLVVSQVRAGICPFVVGVGIIGVDPQGNWLPNGQAAKGGMNKSMLDAAHGQFVQVLEFVAWKLGKVVSFVAPRGTS